MVRTILNMSSRQEKGKLQISASAVSPLSKLIEIVRDDICSNSSHFLNFQLVELKATLFSKQREVRSKETGRGETALANKTVSEKVIDFFKIDLVLFHSVSLSV